MKKKTHEQFLIDISDLNLVVLDEYSGNKTKIRFKCSIDNKIWSARPNDILSGYGCPHCHRLKFKTENDIIEDHGDWLLVDIGTTKYKGATMAIDTDVFNSHIGGRIYANKTKKQKYIYAYYNKGDKLILKHRDIINTTDGMEVDHITHGSITFIDNRRINLRIATRNQNGMNRGVYNSNTSGIVGVRFDALRNKWKAEIKINNKGIFLGRFDSIESATDARKQAEREYFGEYAYGACEQ